MLLSPIKQSNNDRWPPVNPSWEQKLFKGSHHSLHFRSLPEVLPHILHKRRQNHKWAEEVEEPHKSTHQRNMTSVTRAVLASVLTL